MRMIGSHKLNAVKAPYRLNVLKEGGRWFKSKMIELILYYKKPDIFQLLFPGFQVINLGCSYLHMDLFEMSDFGYFGKYPKGRFLAFPRGVIRRIQCGGELHNADLLRASRDNVCQNIGVNSSHDNEIPCPFAKFLSEVEISILDKIYPMFAQPSFDFIGFKVTPEESYNYTIDLNACYQYFTKPAEQVEGDIGSITKKRHELGEQYKNAIKILLKDIEKMLGAEIVLVEKAIIELKSSSHGAIALSDKQEELIQELIANGFKIYIVLAQFKPDWVVEFTVYRMS